MEYKANYRIRKQKKRWKWRVITSSKYDNSKIEPNWICLLLNEQSKIYNDKYPEPSKIRTKLRYIVVIDCLR